MSGSNSHFPASQSLWEFKSYMQMNFINMLNHLMNLIPICPAYALYLTLDDKVTMLGLARGA